MPIANATLFHRQRRKALIRIGILIIAMSAMLTMIPVWLLDICLISMIGIATMILITSLIKKNASILPGILLIATLFRCSLNFATTSLILSLKETGQVIETIGNYAIAPSIYVGIIIFIIFMIIFMIIIKSSTRIIAEISVRFILDAMPAKQIAVDADLTAGKITEKDAHKKRSDIAKNADFYGAADGVMKIIKKDAMVGISLTFINIICGTVLGVAIYGMEIANAAEIFTKLAIGAGFATQIPALIFCLSLRIMTR